jgi:hypothetical protein
MSKQFFEEIQNEMLANFSHVEFGEVSALDTLLYMREIREYCEKTIEVAKQFEEQFSDLISKESESFGNVYKGHEIKLVNGRKMYSFKMISEVESIESQLKQTKEKYQKAFEGFQKGIVQTVDESGKKYWIDDNGELKEFPELSYGKSYLTVKLKK